MNNKTKKYQRIYEQLSPLLQKSPTLTAQIATMNAVLYHKMPSFFWVGVYFKVGETLHVGPYQGPLACQSLEYPKGVCWKAVLEKNTIIVPDVEQFPGHIACDSRSKSEIVIPIFNNQKQVVAVLDIDSNQLATFDETDREGLEKLVCLLKRE